MKTRLSSSLARFEVNLFIFNCFSLRWYLAILGLIPITNIFVSGKDALTLPKKMRKSLKTSSVDFKAAKSLVPQKKLSPLVSKV